MNQPPPGYPVTQIPAGYPKQFQANLGNSIVLNQGSYVQNQYGPPNEPGYAIGQFTSVFDSPRDPNDSQLRVYTLMTSLDSYELPDEPGAHLAVLGLLEYGIGGVQFRAYFDWKMGSQFTFAASFFRLSAAFSEVGELAPKSVRIAGMFSSGSGAPRSQVTRTYPQLALETGGNSTVIFPVPPLAHALNLFAEPGFYETGAVSIRYVGGADNGPSAPSTSLSVFESDGAPFLQALATEDGVRFPESARWVEINFESGEDDYHVTPCFTLSL